MSTTSYTSVVTQGQLGTALLQEGTMESSSPHGIMTMTYDHMTTVQHTLGVDGGLMIASVAT